MASRELNILVAAKGALKAARDIGAVDKSVGGLQRNAGRLAKGAAVGIGAGVTVGAVVIGRGVKSGIESLALLEDASAQVTGAIEQVGLAGRVSAGQVATWANQIEADVDAAFDDKDIVSASANLIRFGKVSEENLQPAMVVMTDLAAKTGDVGSASELLGKALADPAKAAGKLSRFGIILTKTQQDQIKAAVKAGDSYRAQEILLSALSDTTKGAAAASAGPYRDSLNVLADVTEDAQRALGEGFLPVITKVRDILTRELAKPGTMNALRDLGKGLAGGLEKLVDVAVGLPWDSIKSTFQVLGTGAKAALDLFTGMPPWVQTAVLTGWGLHKLTGGALGGIVGELGKGLIKGVLGINAGVVNINAGVVNGAPGIPGGGKGAPAGLPLAAVALPAAAAVATSIIASQDLVNRTSLEERRRNGGLRALSSPAAAAWLRNANQPVTNRNVSGSPDERQIRNDTARMALELQRQGERDNTNTNRIVNAIREAGRPNIRVNLAASDITRIQNNRRKTVRPHGPRNSFVGANEYG